MNVAAMHIFSANRAERRGQSLKFTLGDYCFWQFEFQALVVDPEFAELLNETPGPEESRSGREIHVIRSQRVPRTLPTVAFAGAHLRYVPSQYERYYIEFKGSHRDYLASFSSKSRSTWQRKVRKFAARSGGAIDWRRYKSAAEMAEFASLATQLSKKTYQEKMFGEGFASAVGAGETAAALAAKGAARGYALFLAGAPAAYVFCDCTKTTIGYSVLGFDPAHRELSPGDVLLYLMIESLFEESAFRYLDFGEGGGWYKEFYSTGSVRCARVYYFPRTVANVVAVGLHRMWNGVSSAIGGVLDRFKLRERLRRLLRRRAR